jgi:diguanylate cyclase (GGDEF)-like protein
MSAPPLQETIRMLCWPPLSDACAAALPVDAGIVTLEFADADEARARLNRGDVDLALLGADWIGDEAVLRELSARIAVVLWPADGRAEASAALAAISQGVQDVLTDSDWMAAALPLRLRMAVARQAVARAARTAYATDLATGLPHQQQLIEHMSHLLALREREPAPMALLVLRIEGLLTTEARLGATAAAALRRKLAVRLRSGLRASDVVASIGEDSFAVLLAWIDAVADVDGVAAKLTQAVQRPFSVQGQSVALALSVGIGRYPDDGKDAQTLLQIAQAQASGQPGQGRAGFANHLERGPATAANDDEA